MSDLSITFKAPLKNWHDLIFVSLFLSESVLVLMLFNFKANPVMPYIFTALGFGTFYLTRYLLKSTTILSISEGNLLITQDNRFLNITQELSIAIENLRGYEVNEVTKGFNALFIYDQFFNHYKYSISSVKDQLAIDEYLKLHLTKLDKNSNPLFGSFFSAFLFAIKQMFIFIILSFSVVATLYFLNQKHQFWSSSTPFFICSFLVGFLFWWMIIRLQSKRKYFRFGAYYWLISLFFYTSPMLIFPLLSDWTRIQEQLIVVNHPQQLLAHEDHHLFTIKGVRFNPNLMTLSDLKTGSGNRNGTFPVTHYFVTPLEEGTQIKLSPKYDFWLSKTYNQKVKSSNGPITREKLITSFHEKSQIQFINSFQKDPVFYKIAKLNKDISQLIDYHVNVAKKHIVLEPHWESLIAYREKIQDEMILLIAFLIVLNLIGCVIIAVNR